MTGHKNFSGRKQHELLSCLTHHVLEQFKDAMQQVFNLAFSENPMSSVLLLMNYNMHVSATLLLA